LETTPEFDGHLPPMALPARRSGRPMQDIKLFSLQQRRASERHKRPWIARWSVDGRQRSRAFRTKAEAERYRSLLMHAQHAGEYFDDHSGEPVSWLPRPDDVSMHTWARRWLAEQWPEWRPRTRVSAVEALARLVPLLVPSSASPPPEGLRSYLSRTLVPDGDVPGEAACEQWLDRHCLALGQLTREVLANGRRVLRSTPRCCRGRASVS
jgi:hypothetical protein